MSKSFIAASALAFTLSTPALADPTLGFGINFTFGNGGVNTGVGARVFSDDEQDKAVASVGLDYMFGSQSWRGSLGAAYMMENSYIEMNGGYDFNNGGFDFGIGGGGANTTDQSAPPEVAGPLGSPPPEVEGPLGPPPPEVEGPPGPPPPSNGPV